MSKKYDGAIFSASKLKDVSIERGGYLLVLCKINEYASITCDLEDKGYIIHPYITYQTDKGQKMIVMAQQNHLKPMTENIKKFGIGALNINECRVKINGEDNRKTGNFGTQKTIAGGNGSPQYIPSQLGRFPANLIHNGKIDDVFPVANHKTGSTKNTGFQTNYVGGKSNKEIKTQKYNDKGNASRFFKTCKTEKELVKYLKKLICPKGKRILVDV